MTIHTFSQKVAYRFGLRDCAIVLGYFPATQRFVGISEEHSQRVSAVVSFKRLEKPLARTIFPPSQHKEMIERLYGHLEVPREFGARPEPSIPIPDERPDLRISIVESMGLARMEIERYGERNLEYTRSHLRQLCLKGIDVINLYLNLSDPMTSVLTQDFEQMGFFFAGILPAALSGEDALILQYLNNVPIDYDRIQLESNMGKEILSYVMSRDPNIA